jgi:hypothetical protein
MGSKSVEASHRGHERSSPLGVKTYSGSCHCGAVCYEVTLEPPAKAIACNCSICSQVGWLLAFVPQEAFHLLTSEEELADYPFGKKKSHFPFCKTCGVRAFASGTDENGKGTVGVNLRCIAGIEATTLPVEIVDGAAR